MIPEDTAAEPPDEQSADPADGLPRCVIIKPQSLTIGMYCRSGRGGTMSTQR